jgi:hypothetical protein
VSIFLKTNKAASIRDFLAHHPIVRIKFRKKDGDERTMIATNNPRLMPADAVPHGDGTHNYHTSYPVFDLHQQAWRSFKPDNLIEMEALDNVTMSLDGHVNFN